MNLRRLFWLSHYVLLALAVSAEAQVAPAQLIAAIEIRAVTKLNTTQIEFLKAYSAALEKPLGDLDYFTSVVEGREPFACNLLCRDGVVPNFWLNRPVTPIDLVRYVFTATCYGYLPDEQHRFAALKQLDGVLGSLAKLDVNFYAKLLLDNDNDKKFVRAELGDILLNDDVKFREFTAKFDNIKQLWHHAKGMEKSDTRYNRKTPQSTLDTARQACETSFVNTNVRMPR
jgi:hypothetical protein